MHATPNALKQCIAGFLGPKPSSRATSPSSNKCVRSQRMPTHLEPLTPSFITQVSGYREARRVETEDGFAHVFAINSRAPYVLTALIRAPRRLIYISSELHKQGDPSLSDLNWTERPWQGQQAYSDSKLHNVLLAFAMARRLPGVSCNAMTPGWVQTKMGGPGANDDLDQAHRTQAWLAASDDLASQVSGKYFYHLKAEEPLAAALHSSLQDRFIAACEQLTGIRTAA